MRSRIWRRPSRPQHRGQDSAVTGPAAVPGAHALHRAYAHPVDGLRGGLDCCHSLTACSRAGPGQYSRWRRRPRLPLQAELELQDRRREQRSGRSGVVRPAEERGWESGIRNPDNRVQRPLVSEYFLVYSRVFDGLRERPFACGRCRRPVSCAKSQDSFKLATLRWRPENHLSDPGGVEEHS